MQDDDKVDETPAPGEAAAEETAVSEATEPEAVPEVTEPEPAPTMTEPAAAPDVTESEAAAEESGGEEPAPPQDEAAPEATSDETPAERADAAEPDADESPAPESTEPTDPAREEQPAPEGQALGEPDVLPDELPATSSAELRAIVEALVFVAPQPLTLRELGRVLPGIERSAIKVALAELREDYAREGRGLQLVEVAAGWQITTRPEYNDRVRELIDPKAPTRLSIQALETLAVIAYKQPVTLPEVIELRGVKSGGVVKTLLDKRLIKIVGRKEVVGRPILYGTTKEFLLHFGMKDLSELPKIEEFAEVLGEEIDVIGLKRAIEAPRPAEVPLSEEPPVPADGEAAAEAAPAPADSSEES
jgi:segregation and condensation protein B